MDAYLGTDTKTCHGTSERAVLLEHIRTSSKDAKLGEFTRAAIDALLEQELLLPAVQLLNTARLYDGGSDIPSVPVDTLEGSRMRQANEAVRSLLAYEVMEDREDAIPEAFTDSCKWVLQAGGKYTDFPKWLETGSGLYVITGNEGSGKSTLMKYISKEPRMTSLLETWASSRFSSLVTAAFFFWRSGTPLERSEEGFFRTLLYSVLKERPELTPRVLPNEWASCFTSLIGGSGNSRFGLVAWKVEDLRIAFERLFKLPIDLFLLIDGVDEYQGDKGTPFSIIRYLSQEVTPSQNIKVLASSRPLEEFDALGIRSNINLHDLNQNDIRNYVLGALDSDPRFRTAQTSDPVNAKRVSDHILNTSRSNGSFLWARLAVEMVRKQLLTGVNLYEIQQQLDNRLPSSGLMHDLYQKLWSNMSDAHQAEASEILQIVLAWRSLKHSTPRSGETLRLVDLTLALGDPEATITTAVSPWAEARIRSECRRVADSFTTAWPGFITINQDVDKISTPIQFCHRSVLEFLELNETRQALIALTQTQPMFCPFISHLKSAVQHLKILPKPLHKNPLPLLWVFVESGLSAANKVDSRDSATSQTYGLLLRELDNTMQHHHKNICKDPEFQNRHLESRIQDQNGIVEWRDGGRDYKRLAKMHWSNFHFEHGYSHPRNWKDSFLSLAVQFGLKNYVKSVLENATKTEKSKKGRPLLNYALAPSSISPNAFITPELVKTLLDHGAKPDETFGGKTCWENALLWQYETFVEVNADSFKGSNDEERELAEARARIFLLLLKHDADARASIETSKGQEISAKDIVTRSFQQSTSPETYQKLLEYF